MSFPMQRRIICKSVLKSDSPLSYLLAQVSMSVIPDSVGMTKGWNRQAYRSLCFCSLPISSLSGRGLGRRSPTAMNRLGDLEPRYSSRMGSTSVFRASFKRRSVSVLQSVAPVSPTRAADITMWQESPQQRRTATMHRERDQEIRRRRKRREKALKRRIKELKAAAKTKKSSTS